MHNPCWRLERIRWREGEQEVTLGLIGTMVLIMSGTMTLFPPFKCYAALEISET